MADQFNEFYLPFDSSGVVSTNYIPDTLHTIAGIGHADYQQITPRYGLFFKTGLVVKHVETDTVLELGKDYYLSYYARWFYTSFKDNVYGSIVLLNKTITGNLSITAHYVGGDFSRPTDGLIPAVITEKDTAVVIFWDQIIDPPTEFNPTTHTVSTAELTTGFDDMVTVLWAINDSIIKLGEIEDTINIDQVVGLTDALFKKLDNNGYSQLNKGFLKLADPTYVLITLPKPDAAGLWSIDISINAPAARSSTAGNPTITGDAVKITVIGQVDPTAGLTIWQNHQVFVRNTDKDIPIYMGYDASKFPTIKLDVRGLFLNKNLVAVGSGTFIKEASINIDRFSFVNTNPEKPTILSTPFRIEQIASLGSNGVKPPQYRDNTHRHPVTDIDGLDTALQGLVSNKGVVKTAFGNTSLGSNANTYVEIPLSTILNTDTFLSIDFTLNSYDLGITHYRVQAHIGTGYGWFNPIGIARFHNNPTPVYISPANKSIIIGPIRTGGTSNTTLTIETLRLVNSITTTKFNNLILTTRTTLPADATLVPITKDNSHNHTPDQIDGLEDILADIVSTTKFSVVTTADFGVTTPLVENAGYLFDCKLHAYAPKLPTLDKDGEAIKDGVLIAVGVLDDSIPSKEITLTPNTGVTINGVAGPLVIAKSYCVIWFSYIEANKDWRIVNGIGEGNGQTINALIKHSVIHTNSQNIATFTAPVGAEKLTEWNSELFLNGARLYHQLDYKINPNNTVTLINTTGADYPLESSNDKLLIIEYNNAKTSDSSEVDALRNEVANLRASEVWGAGGFWVNDDGSIGEIYNTLNVAEIKRIGKGNYQIKFTDSNLPNLPPPYHSGHVLVTIRATARDSDTPDYQTTYYFHNYGDADGSGLSISTHSGLTYSLVEAALVQFTIKPMTFV